MATTIKTTDDLTTTKPKAGDTIEGSLAELTMAKPEANPQPASSQEDAAIDAAQQSVVQAIQILRQQWSGLMHDIGGTARGTEVYATAELNLAHQHLLVAEENVLKAIEKI